MKKKKFVRLGDKNLKKLAAWLNYNDNDIYGYPFLQACACIVGLLELQEHEQGPPYGVVEELLSDAYDLRDKIGRQILMKLKKLYPNGDMLKTPHLSRKRKGKI